MPDEGSPDPIDTETTNSTEDAEVLYNYQVRYVDAETGEETTKLIEATQIIADEDHLEMWLFNVMMLTIQKEALIQVRNVSKLDMPL